MSHRAFTAAAIAAAALALPSAASAASVTVTGDSGEAVPLTEGAPVGLRNMTPVIQATLDASDKRFGMKVVAPDGHTDAGLEQGCTTATDASLSQTLKYQGNGTYTVNVITSADENDLNCEQGQTKSYPFTINASTTLTGPGSQVPIRKPFNSDHIEYTFSFGVNPGASAYWLFYGIGATVGPGGNLIGGPDGVSTNYTTDPGVSQIPFDFPSVGNYTLVGQAVAGDGGTPFTPALKIKVVSPFDFSDVPYFADSRGPKYEVRGKLGEQRAAEGARLAVSIAKGKKGGKFKKLARPKIGGVGEFGFKFKLKGRGRYRLKYVFKGTEFVLPGTYIQKAVFKRV
jgi:hypothetical protein